MAPELPSEHRALIVPSVGGELHVKNVPTKKATLGAAVVQVLSASILAYQREIYAGEQPYVFPTPIVGGSSAIGRVASVGADATTLSAGQLVFIDNVIRGRDDPSAVILSAIHEGESEGSKNLMHNIWRDGAFAEYIYVPLENCIPLNEQRLCKDLGYSAHELAYMSSLLVPFGGLRDINVQPGETVIVCPATGGFGGAAVHAAVALGARVIAMGRNENELTRLKTLVESGAPGSVEIVKVSGDDTADVAALQAFGPIDAVLDLSPPAAANSTHFKNAVSTLRHRGRVSSMGFAEPAGLDQWDLVSKNLTLKGRLMYEREDVLTLLRLLERGRFPKGDVLVDVKAFKLDEWNDAFDAAAKHTGISRMVLFAP